MSNHPFVVMVLMWTTDAYQKIHEEDIKQQTTSGESVFQTAKSTYVGGESFADDNIRAKDIRLNTNRKTDPTNVQCQGPSNNCAGNGNVNPSTLTANGADCCLPKMGPSCPGGGWLSGPPKPAGKCCKPYDAIVSACSSTNK